MRIPLASFVALALSSVLVAAVDPPAPTLSGVQAAPSAGAGGQASGPFTLAVLRKDGVVIPFAHFDGRKWSNSWVVPTKAFEVPLSLDDVPDRWWPQKKTITAWTAWPTYRSSRRIETQGPVLLRAHCQRTVGLRTNWAPNEIPPPDGVQPYPKEGVATAGGSVMVEPVQLMADTAPEWKMVAENVSEEVTARELAAVRSLGSVWTHPVPEAQRAKTPFEPEVVLRSHDRASGWDVYYFEGVKRYASKPRPGDIRREIPGAQVFVRPAPGATVIVRSPSERAAAQGKGCELLSFASGWLMLSPGRKPALRLSVDITDCNREGLVYTLPLGALRLNGRLVWIIQVSGYGYERYEIVEIQDAKLKILLATPGGACG
jgi:hypothetical protein